MTRYSSDHLESLLQAYWMLDCTTRRKHRKSHGKISFTELSKAVSNRWKELSMDKRMFYQRVALNDRARYQNQIMMNMISVRIVSCVDKNDGHTTDSKRFSSYN
jgi:HMG (high mobility group) box